MADAAKSVEAPKPHGETQQSAASSASPVEERKGQVDAAASIDISSFLGQWKDSLGNRINVWCEEVREEKRLTAQVGGTTFLRIKMLDGVYHCGHYALDPTASNEKSLVWIDTKAKDSK